MSTDDDYPEWLRRRRSPFFRSWDFEEIDKMFHEMEKMMAQKFKDFTTKVPKDYVRELKLPDGTTKREFGPFVYGYSIKVGPDGKPEIREFGNVKPSLEGPKVKEEREPLVDIIESNGEIHIVVELPGVDKEDIKLRGTETTLTIAVDVPQRYYKEIKLPARVNVRDAKTAYKNGVLEVKLPKIGDEKKPKGEPISIE
jgi:HSP20 family protein